MRKRTVMSWCVAVAAAAMPLAAMAQPVKIIFDTDFETDVDDVGALAVLQALADNGEAEILGTIVVGNNNYSAPAVDAVNTYYGRGAIPIGSIKKTGASSKYTQYLAENFAQDIGSGASAPGAVASYREILAAQPDNSVTIVTVGYATNMRDLLASGPDQYSSLSGTDLVAQKVSKWVNMGGNFETRTKAAGYPYDISPTSNNNWTTDKPATYAAISDWPTAIEFNGREIGHSMRAGADLRNTPANNPVRVAYEKFFSGTALDHHLADLSAVFYAVRGVDHTVGGATEKYWGLEYGQIDINTDASFTWTPGPTPPGARVESRMIDSYTNSNLGLMTPQQIQEIIEDLMVQAPRGADVTGPSSPSNAAAQASTTLAGRMHLTWDASSETDLGSWVAGYQVYRDGQYVGRSLGTSFTDLVPTKGQHDYTVRAYNASGTVGDALQWTITAATSAGSGTGLGAEYFNNKTLGGDPVLTREDATIGFNWGSGSPGAGVNADGFSARWTGRIEAAHAQGTQAYTLTTVFNDGVRLWINGVLVIDDWNNGAERSRTATVDFAAGQFYDIVLEFFENTNTAKVELYWETQGLAKEIVPTLRLYAIPEPATAAILGAASLGLLSRRSALSSLRV